MSIYIYINPINEMRGTYAQNKSSISNYRAKNPDKINQKRRQTYAWKKIVIEFLAILRD